METIREILVLLVFAVEVIGVAVILAGFITATLQYLLQTSRHKDGEAYTFFRRRLARSIILGLEFLIAADIIRTVVVDDTLTNIVNLGLIILIRIVLSFSLHLEVEGRWPWQPARHES